MAIYDPQCRANDVRRYLDRCETADQGVVESFTIITQPAGSSLNGYHDRAPVVLFGDEWRRWLDVEDDVSDLLGSESADRFAVDRRVLT